jgi:hypothetical protein
MFPLQRTGTHLVSIYMRSELIPPKLMELTYDVSPHDALGDSTNQTHHKSPQTKHTVSLSN